MIKVVLAVAGAGKTFSICNNIDVSKRNLILSYTNENIFNIKMELQKRFNAIPNNTIVQTFDSFILDYFIWPYYEKIQLELFGKKYKPGKCLSFSKVNTFNPDKLWMNKSTNFLKYFIKGTEDNYILINESIPTLILTEELKFNDGMSLFEKGLNRIKKFYDCLYIDEFQDYRRDKYHLMIKIMKNVSYGIMYGDYFQHSVVGQNNYGVPFTKKSTYEGFVKELIKYGFEVDNKSLMHTRRCSENVCEFIREKLNITIYSDVNMNRQGEISYVFTKEELDNVFSSGGVRILSLTNEKKWNSISFGLSKGNTYLNTLVVIPDKYLKNKVEGILPIEEGVTKNKIYVALTRATGNTYLTSRKTIKEYFG